MERNIKKYELTKNERELKIWKDKLNVELGRKYEDKIASCETEFWTCPSMNYIILKIDIMILILALNTG